MTVQVEWTLDALLGAFEQHLRRTCGASDCTIPGYCRYVRQFLRAVFADDQIVLTRLRPPDVIEFISVATTHYRPRTVKLAATALRSFLRFLRLQGICQARLDEAVPTAASWRLSTLPRYLREDQLQALLASLDGSTPRARRDRAMVLCLSALGLRASEVAKLRLEDIDWRAGTVHIRTRKTRRGAVLPLPREVGGAIAAYLRAGRPSKQERHVFVLHGRAVGSPIRSHVVGHAVRRALLRAGIAAPSCGTHLLRHTLATRMVRHGASLKEIADVLGHRSLDTTAIYAKVDISSLGQVALPWPEVAS